MLVVKRVSLSNVWLQKSHRSNHGQNVADVRVSNPETPGSLDGADDLGSLASLHIEPVSAALELVPITAWSVLVDDVSTTFNIETHQSPNQTPRRGTHSNKPRQRYNEFVCNQVTLDGHLNEVQHKCFVFPGFQLNHSRPVAGLVNSATAIWDQGV